MAAQRTGARSENQHKNSQKQGEKKSLPPPITVGQFASIVIVKFCKKILLIDTSVKIGLYLIGVMIGSVFADLVQLPKSYFSDKSNVLNRFFVSFGWGWTLMMLIFYVGITSYVFTLGKWNLVKVHMLRLCMATFWWYTTTSLFLYIEAVVGVCSEKKFFVRDVCVRNGKAWLGFDISGHIFLLVHSLLTISEEVKFFKDWKKLGEMLEDKDLQKSRGVKERELTESQKAYKALSPYVKIAIVLLAMLMVVWEFMLIISTVYRFHTTTQKISAAFIAVGCWFVSYRIMLGFGRKGNLKLLKRPGESVLNFTKLS